jgi:uncharacterized surface protein with fasciclin (FAS1) repeats
MVFHINSRLLNSLGLLSAGVLLANTGLVNAQAGAANANPLIAQNMGAPSATPPRVQGVPTIPSAPTATPSSPMPRTIDPMVNPTDTLNPPEAVRNTTIVDVAASNGSFKTLVAAVKAAGLAETLSSEGPFTVFAPTDAAFAALPKGVVENLLKPENKALLTKILTYHVVSGKVLSTDLKTGSVDSVEGSPIVVKLVTSTAPAMSTTAAAKPKAMTTIMVNQAKVKIADVAASNGVIHAIDQVILPPDIMEQLSKATAPAAKASGKPVQNKPAMVKPMAPQP